MQFAGDLISELSANTAADIVNPKLRLLYAYWDSKRAGAPWPPRAAIEPLDLKELLGHLVIVDVVPAPEPGAAPRFRYRLFGSTVAHRMGFDMTGKWIDEWPAPEYRDYLNRSYAEVFTAARPFRRLRRLVKDDRKLDYESLMLPLGPPQAVEQILAAQLFDV